MVVVVVVKNELKNRDCRREKMMMEKAGSYEVVMSNVLCLGGEVI